MAQANEYTLLAFNSIDIRDTNAGDVVVFRTGSLTHSQDLPTRHGTYARVTGFSKSRTGASQVQVTFKDGKQIAMAPSNLVRRTPEVDQAAVVAHGLVMEITSRYTEQHREFLIVPSLQLALGEMGMYDRLQASANTPKPEDDLPY